MKIKERLEQYSWYNSIKSDYVYKTLVFSVLGAFITVGFAIYNAVFGIVNKSLWYGTFAGYYILLVLQKTLLLVVYGFASKKYQGDKIKLEKTKEKLYFANGFFFIPLTIAFSVIAALLISSQKPIVSDEVLAITIATYAFYKITMTSLNLRKAKKSKDRIVQAIRNINFVDAITSIMLLESTLVTTFGDLTYDMKVMIALTCLAAAIFIIGLGLYMMISSKKRYCNDLL